MRLDTRLCDCPLDVRLWRFRRDRHGLPWTAMARPARWCPVQCRFPLPAFCVGRSLYFMTAHAMPWHWVRARPMTAGPSGALGAAAARIDQKKRRWDGRKRIFYCVRNRAGTGVYAVHCIQVDRDRCIVTRCHLFRQQNLCLFVFVEQQSSRTKFTCTHTRTHTHT